MKFLTRFSHPSLKSNRRRFSENPQARKIIPDGGNTLSLLVGVALGMLLSRFLPSDEKEAKKQLKQALDEVERLRLQTAGTPGTEPLRTEPIKK
jgi:hypothetical protein